MTVFAGSVEVGVVPAPVPVPGPGGTGVDEVVCGPLDGGVDAAESCMRWTFPSGPVLAPVAANAPLLPVVFTAAWAASMLSLPMYALCHWAICASVSGSRLGSAAWRG